MTSTNTENENHAAEDNHQAEAEAESKYLLELQNKNELLKIELEEKSKLILELEREKELKESNLENLLSSVDSKIQECLTEDRARKAEVENEQKWNDKLKSARIQRMASVLEYKNQMAELRKQVFSPADLDDAKINEEIEYLLSFYEELNEKNKLLQLEIGDLEKRTCSETDASRIIDSVTALTKQLKLETDSDRNVSNEMRNQMMVLDKKISENIATND